LRPEAEVHAERWRCIKFDLAFAAADTVMNEPSANLMVSVFPGVPLASPVA
jgi:hypothetical protein